MFSHGSDRSRGVMILVKENFDCELKVCHIDSDGTFIILRGQIQDHPFVLINIYAPNRANDQCTFFEEIQMRLNEFEIDADSDIIIGGDFSDILDCDRDGFGGKPKLKIAGKKIENLCSSFDLIDIWRIRNPESKLFTWKQNNPLIQRRLDFWLTSSNLQEEIENVDIVPAIRTDHSAITLHVNGIDETAKGPSYWKFNASLLEDERYVALINEKYDKC